MWLEARDEGTDNSDGEHPDVHQVGGVSLVSHNSNGKVHPDKEKCCRHRNADGGSVRQAQANAFSALGVLNRHSSRQFYVGSEALARRNSKADPTHSVAKNPFSINVKPNPAICAITATNI